MKTPTLLDKVRSKLAGRRGAELHAIADDARVSYDTLLRIRDQYRQHPPYDPAFSKVQRLAVCLRVVRK